MDRTDAGEIDILEAAGFSLYESLRILQIPLTNFITPEDENFAIRDWLQEARPEHKLIIYATEP